MLGMVNVRFLYGLCGLYMSCMGFVWIAACISLVQLLWNFGKKFSWAPQFGKPTLNLKIWIDDLWSTLLFAGFLVRVLFPFLVQLCHLELTSTVSPRFDVPHVELNFWPVFISHYWMHVSNIDTKQGEETSACQLSDVFLLSIIGHN